MDSMSGVDDYSQRNELSRCSCQTGRSLSFNLLMRSDAVAGGNSRWLLLFSMATLLTSRQKEVMERKTAVGL